MGRCRRAGIPVIGAAYPKWQRKRKPIRSEIPFLVLGHDDIVPSQPIGDSPHVRKSNGDSFEISSQAAVMRWVARLTGVGGDIREQDYLAAESGSKMNDLAITLVVVWFAGFLFLYGRWLNFLRLLYNNLDPTKDYTKTRLFVRNWFFRIRLFPKTDAQIIDSANLTNPGRQYQKQAIQNERVLFAWCLGGGALLVLMSSNATLVPAILAAAPFMIGMLYFWIRRLRRYKQTG